MQPSGIMFNIKYFKSIVKGNLHRERRRVQLVTVMNRRESLLRASATW